jgi:hypothetical protein
LVDGRYFPVRFPAVAGMPSKPTWPAIRGVQVGVETFPDICGDAAEDQDSPRVQLDIVSTIAGGYDAHAQLRSQVKAAMANFPVPALIELELEDTDEETATYRSILDYSLQG